LKIFEAESGVLVHTFKDKIQSEVERTTPPGEPTTTRILTIAVVKDHHHAQNGDASSSSSSGGGLFDKKGKNAKLLKNSASYNNDLVVYVHEMKKPSMCHVLVRVAMSIHFSFSRHTF
jgi:hypothetical protein